MRPLLFLVPILLLVLFFSFTKPKTELGLPTPTPTPTPPASPSTTPAPHDPALRDKPLTFSEMNALYGPCVSLPVLMYHHTQDSQTAAQNGNGYLTVTPETFEKQLAYLNDQHYVSIGPADLIAFFNSGQSLPKKPIMLTFDDGYSDFATVAAPLLTRYSIKATVFVPTGLLENPGYLSWSNIASLAQSGFYFGNHTWSHQNLGTSLEKIKKEVDTAKLQLTDHGQDPFKVFAYPYGTISQRASGYLRQSGYQLAFTTIPGRVQCQKQRLSLPRIRIGNTALSFYGL